MKGSGEYYVYALVDTRSDKPFYIGKGKGKRAAEHVKAARRGEESPKARVIREILEAGFRVEERILKRFKNEDAAYNYEKRLISKIGLGNLTNLAPGGRCCWSYKKDEQKEKDSIVVYCARKAAIVLSRGLIPVYRLGGRDFEIPKSVTEKIMSMLYDVYKRRGARWIERRGLTVVCN